MGVNWNGDYKKGLPPRQPTEFERRVLDRREQVRRIIAGMGKVPGGRVARPSPEVVLEMERRRQEARTREADKIARERDRLAALQRPDRLP